MGTWRYIYLALEKWIHQLLIHLWQLLFQGFWSLGKKAGAPGRFRCWQFKIPHRGASTLPFIIHSPEMISRLYPTTNRQRGIALLCACRKGKCGKQLVSSTYLSLWQSVMPRSMWLTSSPVSQTAVTQLGAKAHVRGEAMSRHGEGFFSYGFNFPFPFSCVWNLTHLPGLYLAHEISFKSSTIMDCALTKWLVNSRQNQDDISCCEKISTCLRLSHLHRADLLAGRE